MLTQEFIRERFDYDPETGSFTWRVSSGGMHPGDEAGFVNGLGYRRICVKGFGQIGAHRLAWLYVHGVLPKIVDHKDLNRSNNRIDNLRLATRAQNIANQAAHKDNTSGFKGVSYLPNRKKPWRATIMCRGKWKFLGYYDTPEAAHAAYLSAAQSAFGEFARAA